MIYESGRTDVLFLGPPFLPLFCFGSWGRRGVRHEVGGGGRREGSVCSKDFLTRDVHAKGRGEVGEWKVRRLYRREYSVCRELFRWFLEGQTEGVVSFESFPSLT